MRRTGLVVVAAVAVAAVLGWASPAAASDVHLTVTTPQQTYEPGAAVPLRFVVTSGQDGPCDLAAAADGSVSVLAATRDGQALAPAFFRALINAGSATMLAGQVERVGPGAAVSFTLDAADPQGLTTMTPLSDQSALAAVWPTTDIGKYRIDLAYQAAPIAGPDVCAGRSNVVTVAFEVKRPLPSWLRPGLAALGGIVLILIAVVVLFRRRPARASALFVVLLVAGVFAVPGRARADISYSGGTDTASNVVYGGCAGQIEAYQPQMWARLNGKDGPRIRIYQWIFSERVQLGDNPRDSLIKWDYQDKSHIEGEAAGVDYDPCAELYHELEHAKDAAAGGLSDAKCGDSNVLVDEIRATLAENAYRKAHQLQPRTGYGGIALPSSIEGCRPGKKTKKDKTVPASAKPAGAKKRCAAASCGGTYGDPHLITFDDQRYEFQAAGEFTAVEAEAGDLLVQVRQTPMPGSTAVAINTAVAVRAGGTRLGFYLADGVLSVHRDGRAIKPGRGDTELGGGAVLGRGADPYTGDVYDVTWADGTVASLWRTGAYGLNVVMSPAGTRTGTLSGLLGDFDGDFHDDKPASADQWRLTEAASLFDYADGQSTATFTDRAFPASAPPQVSPSARQACALTGVTDPTGLADCLLDVSLTGAADFAIAAADVAQLTTPVKAGALEVDEAGAVAHRTFSGETGQRAYVRVVSTSFPDQCGALTLHAPGGRTIGLGCLRTGGEIDGTVLPVGGEYRIDVDPDGDAVGPVTLDVVVSDDQRAPVAVGGEPVTATIDAAGGQSRFAFTATAGQLVTVDAGAATIPDQCAVLQIAAADGATKAEGCLTGGAGHFDLRIPVDGTYYLVVDPAHAATGEVTLRVS